MHRVQHTGHGAKSADVPQLYVHTRASQLHHHRHVAAFMCRHVHGTQAPKRGSDAQAQRQPRPENRLPLKPALLLLLAPLPELQK
jgi:hypothetical protein